MKSISKEGSILISEMEEKKIKKMTHKQFGTWGGGELRMRMLDSFNFQVNTQEREQVVLILFEELFISIAPIMLQQIPNK